MSLGPGLKGSAETVVVHENTAAAVGSGALEVFATPSMLPRSGAGHWRFLPLRR